jgi:arylsulfatase A-like enzyme
MSTLPTLQQGGYFWQKSYLKNGQQVELDEFVYYPDVAHEFALDFIRRRKDEPFFFYYSSHLVHAPIVPTPDSKLPAGTAPQDVKGGAGPNQPYYADNVAYLDKQVGSVVAELEKLGLREKTLIIFTADNGIASESTTIHGRQINGHKGTMLEGGAHVPLIASWKGVTPAGTVLKDLVDFSDLLPTFAELAGAKLPENVIFDGRSFAPQLRGQKGPPREWIFVQLGAQWYVRDAGRKLNQKGELFDMSDAPFVETLVPVEGQNAEAAAARARLQAVLDNLNPAGGKQVPPGAEKPRPRQQQRKKAA